MIASRWNARFVAYEDALASFYELQDAVTDTVEQSKHLHRLAVLKRAVIEFPRELASPDGSVAEIERERAIMEIDRAPFEARRITAHRRARHDAVLDLTFRIAPVDTARLPSFVRPVRITFPFGDSAFSAKFRLVRLTLDASYVDLTFVTADPV